VERHQRHAAHPGPRDRPVPRLRRARGDHALDTSPDQVLAQNRQRQASVPESVIARLIETWEPPSLLEAHAVDWMG
jgi:hypothetical protein